MLPRFLITILDYLFPYRCIGCRREEGTLLCSTCRRTIETATTQHCPVCKKTITEKGVPCSACKGKTALDYLMVATYDTTGIVRRMIHFFKYRFITAYESPLSGLMLGSFLTEVLTNENLILVPVPLHPARLTWRGFNQAYLLARAVGSIADIAVCSHFLRRVRKTKSQMTLNREKRLHNVAGAFVCAGPLPKGKEIILIDDIATTRATLEACAAALKKHGAGQVGALVISRGT